MVPVVGVGLVHAQAAVGIPGQSCLGGDQEVGDNIILVIVNVLIAMDLDRVNILIWNVPVIQVNSYKSSGR